MRRSSTGVAGLVVLALLAFLPMQPAAARRVEGALASGALRVQATPATVGFGQSVTLSGTLTDPAGAALPGERVVAETRTPGGGWVAVSEPALTDSAGVVALTVAPAVSSTLRLRHDDPEGVSSALVSVVVRAALTAGWADPAVRVGSPAHAGGSLAPAPTGAEIRLERRVQGRWRLVESVPVRPDGSWSATVRPVAAGFEHLRAVRRAGAGVAGSTERLPPLDVFRLHRYSVTTRGRVTADVAGFRAAVAATYADQRGWARAHHRFREVGRASGSSGALTVVLAQAATVPGFHPVCSSFYSCRVGRYVVINEDRWRRGSPYFPGGLRSYRQMVVNHETGHWLGRGHASCPGAGRPAPVMQQQSKGLHGCRANPWPLDREIRAVS
jgi:hypothetical protein